MAESRRQWFLNQIFGHRAALVRYVRKLDHADDIEDLIQETYRRVYSLPACGRLGASRAALFKAARDLCSERAGRRTHSLTDSPADVSDTGVQVSKTHAVVQLDEQRRREAFNAALDQFPPLCRRVFTLRKLYRLSHGEIAEVLGVSHSTIEQHVAKGLLQCRDHLKRVGLLSPQEVRSGLPPSRLRDRGDLE